ncbi:MAG: DNA polymerase IV [Desulfosarcina sp.]|nr:DNA polymerase IV [Desulfobacterales bacterium]
MILHLDMDAFYASVEQLDRPELRGQCVIVGGASNRGVVTTASYEARRYGVRSAMPMFEARRRCPSAIIVPGRMHRYKEISRLVIERLRQFSPLVEQVSIDEAYLDISGCERLHGTPGEMGATIKKAVHNEVQLTCSIGIAPLRFLAKIASDINKPDGLTIIPAAQVMPFIDRLPIHKVPGVGPKSLQKLENMGITMLGNVRRLKTERLVNRLGKFGYRLAALANGEDRTPVTPSTPAKSFSSEVTLTQDLSDRSVLLRHILHQAEDVGRQLRRHGLKARTVTLKIKYTNFRQITRSATLPQAVQSSEVLYEQAARLLVPNLLQQKIRLIGMGASNLVAVRTPAQLDLFNNSHHKPRHWNSVDQAVDAINIKFGRNTVNKANLIDPSRTE